MQNVNHIHFIGIGGIGMSGLAEYLVEIGFKISGSDLVKTNITERLENLGITIFIGHQKENILNSIDLIVYTSAVKNDNEEFLEAQKLNIKCVKRAVMLGEIVNDKYLIAISGTHGKTTTTAMISKVLIDNNFDPIVFVGGNVSFLNNASSRIGKGKVAVVEADEYDRSFLTLKPDISIITNIELDHTDIYNSLVDLKNTFKKFLENGKQGMKVIAFGDDENVNDLLSNSNFEILKYGFDDSNNYKIDDYKSFGMNSIYNLNGEEINISVNGKHNALDSVAAKIVSDLMNISSNAFKSSINKFNGVNRRLELKYNKDIAVFDDYAHHPSEVYYSLNAVKSFAKGRVITIFQPHTYTRTRDLYKDFANALKDNDVLILTKVYPAREKEINGINSKLIFNELKNISTIEVYCYNNFDEIIEKLKDIIRKNDTLIFQGAGDITNLCDKYIKLISN